MEFTQNTENSLNGLITKPERTKIGLLFPVIPEIGSLAIELDKTLSEILDNKLGTGWDPDKLSTEYVTNADPTVSGRRYRVKYDGEEIGIVRNTVAVQHGKAIGNFYIEIKEEKVNGGN